MTDKARQDAPPLGRLTDPQIRGIAVCDGGLYQDDETAEWSCSDAALMKFARAILAQAAPASTVVKESLTTEVPVQQAGHAIEGWKPMPIEPTEEMLRSAERSMDRGDWIGAWYWRKGYAAMIAAAPRPGADHE